MRHRDDGVQLVRVSIAAALSWLICERLLSDTTPVLAPLTAILCGQVTVYRSVATALQRAAGVIVGVLLAFAVAHGLGLHSWSVGLVTAAALMIGATLRLRSESAEIAVSALLVLAVGSVPQFAADRILESLIGGAVGVAINFVLVPSVYVRSADRRLAELAAESGDLLAEIGGGLGREWHRDDARNWLTRARLQSDDIVGARETLDRAEESLRYNPRRHRAPGSVDHLRSGLDSLEHAAALVRSIARTLLDIVESASEGTPHQAGLIDFPQVSDISSNSKSDFILRRDINRVCEYFIRQGVRCGPAAITRDLWERYGGLADQQAALLAAEQAAIMLETDFY